MELREPPRTTPPARIDRSVRWLLIVQLLLLLALATLYWQRSGPVSGQTGAAEHLREVASKLKAAGALEEAAALYEDYLSRTDAPADTKARVAYSLGNSYLDRGLYASALRWFYEAETFGAGELEQEVGEKIVHSLERLGRYHAAQAALDSRVRLSAEEDPAATRSSDDPVVARIGQQEIYRSDLDRALDEMPPQVAGSLSDPARREDLLRKLVADELLWRKAKKLEYDKDPEVLGRLETLHRELAAAKFVEQEMVSKVAVDPGDLRNFHAANKGLYEQPEAVRLRLIQVESRAQAESLSARLQQGADFAELARSESQDEATRSSGGLLARWITRGDNFLGLGDPAPITATVFATDTGAATPAIEADGRFYLFRVEEKRPARSPAFEEISSLVERDYRMRKVQTAYEDLIESELATEEVKLFPERLLDAER